MATKWVTKQLKENIQFFSDLCALNVVHVAITIWPMGLTLAPQDLLTMALIGNAIWIMLHTVVWPQKLNRSWTYGRHVAEVIRFVGVQFAAIFITNLLLFDEQYSAMMPVYMIILLATFGLSRVGLVWFLRVIRSNGYNFKRVIVIGSEELVSFLKKELDENSHYGYRLLGAFGEHLRLMEYHGEGQDSSVDVFDFLIRENIDEVFISSNLSQDKVMSLMTFCQLNSIVINITHDFLNGIKLEPMDMSLRVDGLSPTLTIRENWYAGLMRTDAKRLFDLFTSVAFLVFVGSWLFPIIALLVKLESKGPVFFKQQRSGLNNQVFWCYKFRTMKVNNESDTRQAAAGDERITRIGGILRKTNLDELPQLINVLFGEMSIVGPRPHMLKHTEEYGKIVDYYNERLWIKPGITGLAQSKGFRGEIREVSQLINRIYHDRYYVRNWSFLLDIKIILFTTWNMISFQRLGI